ncbi:hypothetical protein BBK82_03295 [Lentzea guizhouensis]|uniref:Uncharacterized protein n=1 Tax=Lentzea guizhouensis TaxID=1586287 RepID=A0A1B2HC08_9PSEU|nr:hypothetical protein [Lentzea guizhouensis]ANZ35243.1 hypothetical protein BBK82_03295 [Lentzea guizhouensis]
MTDPQQFGGTFALHADDAEQPLVVDALKHEARRALKQAVARDGRRITTPLHETWTLERRGEDDQIVREPWEPGQPSAGALRVVYRTNVVAERRADEFPPPYPGMPGLGPHIPVLHDQLDAIIPRCCTLPLHHGEPQGRMDVNGRCICDCHVELP